MYLSSAIKQFRFYKLLGQKTIERLTENELCWQYNEESNSVAIIMQHMAGNMLSRWSDFLTTDGEKTWRNRDEEFEASSKSKDEMMEYWNTGWECLFQALESLQEHDLTTIIYIRNEGHSVLEAINRQLAHYSYHVGQIVFIGKMVQSSTWESLSIPKGNSATYNTAKFEQSKQQKHFTDDWLT